ncbi:hypothetical protein ASE36_18185 [Rhizobium sp. Root274]|uniref:GDYXXLXY domain-containing protein n=1 Tax=unclassified Rhizobium TaxID=2613769 RepID=UPI000715880C|nr:MULTISPECIES: GDYXXLXY domain-containing protein [unclassified Rhizobium]KQW27529.1 hypothetical protein ASC71_18210 [Rhizobium sp. Root1240]KRD27766.1 hypothetical protein ASE36_18185 [Rhizobium sp. Root274]
MIAAKPFAAVALLVAVAQTAILGFMIEGRASILRSGTEVLLKTAPVDPRDLLRGDYVVLSYDIATVPVSLFKGPKPTDGSSGSVEVRIKPGVDGFWTVAEASTEPLQPEEGSVILHSQPIQFSDWQWAEGSSLFLSYGIERYYVPEGEGRPIEDGRNEGRVSVAVRVSDEGVAQIRALMLDGDPLYEEPLY